MKINISISKSDADKMKALGLYHKVFSDITGFAIQENIPVKKTPYPSHTVTVSVNKTDYELFQKKYMHVGVRSAIECILEYVQKNKKKYITYAIRNHI